jgi:hypothetical protein
MFGRSFQKRPLTKMKTTLKYCRKHDFAFCPSHYGECVFGKDCFLEIESRATFCAICDGLLERKGEPPLNRRNYDPRCEDKSKSNH